MLAGVLCGPRENMMHLRRCAGLVLAALMCYGGLMQESSAQDAVLQQLFQEEIRARGIGPIADQPIVEPLEPYPVIDSELTESEYRSITQRQKLEELRPTPLELDFSARAGTDLKQFGYELFHTHKTRLVATNLGGAPDDYVLGVGDSIIVTFRGQLRKSGSTKIDSEGRLVLKDLPPLVAVGRTFGELRKELESLTEETLLGSEIYISLGSVRRISILVVGEVRNPGAQALPAYSTIIDAIALSGGIRKTGSLRNIQVVRGDEIFWLDLYDLIFMGTLSRDVVLRNGDRIVVPAIGETVAAAGWVNRPGIYELRVGGKTPTLDDMLKFGGGAVRPTGNRLLHITLEKDGRQLVEERKQAEEADIRAGDILLVELGQNIQHGNVRAMGHVSVEARRSLASAPTLRALLADGSILENNPYLLLGAVETTDTNTWTRRLYPVNLRNVFSGSVDYRLHDKDAVLVFSASDIEYLMSDDVQQFLVSENPQDLETECVGLRALKKAIVLGTPGKYDAAVLYKEKSTPKHQERLEDPVHFVGYKRLVLEERRVALSERQAKLAEMKERIRLDPLQSDELVKVLSEKESPCPELFERFPKALPFLLEHTMMLQGEIRSPGIYPITSGTDLAAIVSAAEGLSRDGDVSHVEIINRSSRSGATKSKGAQDLSQTGLASVQLEPGDTVQIGKRFLSRSSGSVSILGEVRHPGRYTITRGERMSDIIVRAGGFTAEAYSDGAVFTRQSAKKRERLGYQRSAVELERSIVTALSSKRGRAARAGGGIEIVSQLVDTLRSIEPVGRVVVETDPLVLSRSPELDILMEAGDQLFIPKRPSSVTVSGEVLNPGAIQYAAGLKTEHYIEMAGGVGQSGDDNKVFVVFPDGSARPVSISYWNYDSREIPPGSTVVVPRDVTPVDFVSLAKDITQIFSQLAIRAASLAELEDD